MFRFITSIIVINSGKNWIVRGTAMFVNKVARKIIFISWFILLEIESNKIFRDLELWDKNPIVWKNRPEEIPWLIIIIKNAIFLVLVRRHKQNSE